MHFSTTFGLLAVAFGFVRADFVADFFDSSDSCNNGDDPAKSTTFSGNCLQLNDDYENFKLSKDDGTALEQCGPFFKDDDCTEEADDTDTFACSSCADYSNDDDIYVYVA